MPLLKWMGVSNNSNNASTTTATTTNATTSSTTTAAAGATALNQGADFKRFGLENTANICYANAVLQALYFCGPFRDLVCQTPDSSSPTLPSIPGTMSPSPLPLPPPPPSSTSATTSTPSRSDKRRPADPTDSSSAAVIQHPRPIPPSPPTIFSALRSLFLYISTHPNTTGTVAPTAFINKLKKEHEEFNNNGHHDAHEFLGFLLNGVGENLEAIARELEREREREREKEREREREREKLEKEKNPTVDDLSKSISSLAPSTTTTTTTSSSSPASSHPNSLSTTTTTTSSSSSAGNPTTVLPTHTQIHSHSQTRPRTLIQSLFEGTLTSETRCLTCETVSSRDESFLDLSIDIEQNSSITACLRQFSASETLCQKDKFFCDWCCGLQEAEKRMKIKKSPPILALHLKRFKLQWEEQKYIKLSYRVAFPLDLRLFNTVDASDVGSTGNGGEDLVEVDRLYNLIAIVVHIGGGAHQGHYIAIIKSADKQWWVFDDDTVETIKESEISKYFGDASFQSGSSTSTTTGATGVAGSTSGTGTAVSNGTGGTSTTASGTGAGATSTGTTGTGTAAGTGTTSTTGSGSGTSAANGGVKGCGYVLFYQAADLEVGKFKGLVPAPLDPLSSATSTSATATATTSNGNGTAKIHTNVSGTGLGLAEARATANSVLASVQGANANGAHGPVKVELTLPSPTGTPSRSHTLGHVPIGYARSHGREESSATVVAPKSHPPPPGLSQRQPQHQPPNRTQTLSSPQLRQRSLSPSDRRSERSRSAESSSNISSNNESTGDLGGTSVGVGGQGPPPGLSGKANGDTASTSTSTSISTPGGVITNLFNRTVRHSHSNRAERPLSTSFVSPPIPTLPTVPSISPSSTHTPLFPATSPTTVVGADDGDDALLSVPSSSHKEHKEGKEGKEKGGWFRKQKNSLSVGTAKAALAFVNATSSHSHVPASPTVSKHSHHPHHQQHPTAPPLPPKSPTRSQSYHETRRSSGPAQLEGGGALAAFTTDDFLMTPSPPVPPVPPIPTSLLQGSSSQLSPLQIGPENGAATAEIRNGEDIATPKQGLTPVVNTTNTTPNPFFNFSLGNFMGKSNNATTPIPPIPTTTTSTSGSTSNLNTAASSSSPLLVSTPSAVSSIASTPPSTSASGSASASVAGDIHLTTAPTASQPSPHTPPPQPSLPPPLSTDLDTSVISPITPLPARRLDYPHPTPPYPNFQPPQVNLSVRTGNRGISASAPTSPAMVGAKPSSKAGSASASTSPTTTTTPDSDTTPQAINQGPGVTFATTNATPVVGTRSRNAPSNGGARPVSMNFSFSGSSDVGNLSNGNGNGISGAPHALAMSTSTSTPPSSSRPVILDESGKIKKAKRKLSLSSGMKSMGLAAIFSSSAKDKEREKERLQAHSAPSTGLASQTYSGRISSDHSNVNGGASGSGANGNGMQTVGAVGAVTAGGRKSRPVLPPNIKRIASDDDRELAPPAMMLRF